MNKKSVQLAIALFFVMTIAIAIAYQMIKPVKRLPVYGKNAETASQHFIKDFSLLNQNGETITLKNLDDKIIVADFFFSTCKGICPKMTGNMKKVYETFKGNNNVQFLSHTVNPEGDSVSVLNAYSKMQNAESTQWNFLTGDKKQIYNLARESYITDGTKGDGGKEDFVHTQYFALVDKSKQIRGYYDGTNNAEIEKLISDIKTLLEE